MANTSLWIDGRMAVNGKQSHVNLSNPIALHDFVRDYLAANPTLITGVQTLAQVLAVGNITGAFDIEVSNGQVIKAVSGGSTLNLRDGADNQFGIYTDAGAGAESYITGNTSNNIFGFGGFSFYSANATESLMTAQTAVSTVYMTPNSVGIAPITTLAATYTPSFVLTPSTGTVTVTGVSNVGMFLNTGATPCIYNIGVDNSVIIGGLGITAKTNNTAYANQLGLNASGSAFEGLLDTATLTADRTYELPNASGIVNLTRYVAVNTPTVHTAVTGEVIAVTTGGVALVVNLPSAVIANQVITIKKVDAGVGTVDVTPAGAETIDGALSKSLSSQWNSITVISNGSNWLIIAGI